jgi:hypothetical protein
MTKPKKKAKLKPRAKATRPKPEAAAKPRRPRQPRLPGTEDAAIQDLENAALDYQEAKDELISARNYVDQCEGALLSLMKKYGRTHYLRDGIEVTHLEKRERVKVTIKKKGEAGFPVEAPATGGSTT